MRATPDFDFALGETADMIRETTARFADEQIAPLAAKADAEDWFPRDELWMQMGELGLHGITVEEEFGGLGLGYLEHRPRSAFPMARTRTCASTRSAAGAMPRKRRNISPS
jgi:alkylation response protein AidB-like acyl-CoA dehydrogenase